MDFVGGPEGEGGWSAEAEIELEVAEPGDVGIDVLLGQLSRQMLVVLA